jgi:Methylenetetrahydrofolate reductase
MATDLIITQMFFDSAVFIQFVKDCRNAGITCPIVPGLMCINTVAGFFKMAGFCKSRVPSQLAIDMTELRERNAPDADVKAFGVKFGTQLCRDILATGEVNVLHFYTLNLEKVVYGILQELGLGNSDVLEQQLSKNVESDAAQQTAVGSAWARVGDIVQTIYGQGTVTQLNQQTGAATIQITSWTLANDQKPIAFLQKSSYTKIMTA